MLIAPYDHLGGSWVEWGGLATLDRGAKMCPDPLEWLAFSVGEILFRFYFPAGGEDKNIQVGCGVET